MKLKIVIIFALCAFPVALFLASPRAAGQAVNVAKTKDQAIEDLVYGNRILYNEGVLDAFGHISVRDPQDPTHFYMSRGIAPSQVTAKDILKYDMQCNAVDAPPNTGYGERFIHCGVFRARPDVNVVIHAHSLPLIPFGLTKTPLRPLFLMAGWMGTDGVPVFDIRDVAPDTNIMVTNNMFGDALAKVLGKSNIVLMRGHGETVVGTSVQEAVVHAYYAVVNAQLQADSMKLGGNITYLSPGEAANSAKSVGIGRPWDMFKARVGKIE
jgi:HCOMODA/2-hydroxy-3-carboxy-muconic semialdehyde decarboxylase